MTDDLLRAAARQLRAADRRSRWHDDPALFVREAFTWRESRAVESALTGGGGFAATPYQTRALAALEKCGKLALRSPHGAGKTTVCAWGVLWFAITRESAGEDWKVATTAGSWRQLEVYLWPEIRSWTARLRWDVLGIPQWVRGRDSFDLGLKLGHGAAFAAAATDPALLEGAHADQLLVVLDEAKAVEDPLWDSLEGALSGPGSNYALAVSTPGPPSGRFYDICQRRPGLRDWQVQHITLQEAIAAGRISADWAQARREQWGAESAVFANRVLGEFASSDEDGVVPLAWVEAANDRWQAWQDLGAPVPGGRLVVGCDIARFGSDRTALALRRGNYVIEVRVFAQADTMTTSGRISGLLPQPTDLAVVDVIGLGSGVYDRLKEQGKAVVAFASSNSSHARDRSRELSFSNRRAESWWRLRELLDPAYGATLALPPDDALVGDLCAPRWSISSGGKIVIEAKDDVRKRLGRSPDIGDAVVMALSVDSYAATGPLPAAVPWGRGGAVEGAAIPWKRDPDQPAGGFFPEGPPSPRDVWITADGPQGDSWPW
ncbi:MAG: hypothetical protein ACYCS9_05820 [Candidatus Dormibacteria bacterium]